MGYCGCATSSGKVRWAAIVGLSVLAVALIIGGVVESLKCEVCTPGEGCERRSFTYQKTAGEDAVVLDENGDVIEGASTFTLYPWNFTHYSTCVCSATRWTACSAAYLSGDVLCTVGTMSRRHV